jgi:hemoglobin
MDPAPSLFQRLGERPGLLRLVNHFYADVRQHQLLGPVFEAQIQNWPEHIEMITDFWTQILGGPSRYTGQMPARHIPLRLREEHFQAWLGLWDFNCQRWLAPDCADELIGYARQIARRLRQFCGLDSPDSPPNFLGIAFYAPKPVH